jgi:hypothetical protein
MPPDLTFAFVGGRCCPTLDFVIAFWIMIKFYTLLTSLFCIYLNFICDRSIIPVRKWSIEDIDLDDIDPEPLMISPESSCLVYFNLKTTRLSKNFPLFIFMNIVAHVAQRLE